MGDQRSDGLPCDRRGGVGQSSCTRNSAGTQSDLCCRCAAGASRRAGNSSRRKFDTCAGTHARSAASRCRTGIGHSLDATRGCDGAWRADLGMPNEWSEDVFG